MLITFLIIEQNAYYENVILDKLSLLALLSLRDRQQKGACLPVGRKQSCRSRDKHGIAARSACWRIARNDRRGNIEIPLTINYILFPINSAISTKRLVYPHSLSYHEETFTRLPFATVNGKSTMEESGFPL